MSRITSLRVPSKATANSALRRAQQSSKGYLGALVVLLLLTAFVWVNRPVFADPGNLRNVLLTNSGLAIVAVGMTFVILTGGFDLSVGAQMAVAQQVLVQLLEAGVSAALAVVLVFVMGFAIGALLNGTLIGVLGVNFFVVTLGTMTLLYGLVNVLTNGETRILDAPGLQEQASRSVLGVPTPTWLALAVLVAGWVLLQRLIFGRSVYCVGGNREAARLAGIADRRVLVLTYGVCGACAALAGAIDAARFAAATPTTGTGIALTAGAAVLIGGTSLAGGIGGLAGTVVGVGVFAVLANAVNLLGVNAYWQGVVAGLVLIAATALDRSGRRPGRGRRLPWPRTTPAVAPAAVPGGAVAP